MQLHGVSFFSFQRCENEISQKTDDGVSFRLIALLTILHFFDICACVSKSLELWNQVIQLWWWGDVCCDFEWKEGIYILLKFKPGNQLDAEQIVDIIGTCECVSKCSTHTNK